MNDFPQEWELLSFFEAEPQLADPHVPWCYNRLTFDSLCSDGRIHCVIEPGYETFKLQWTQGAAERLSVSLHSILSVVYRREEGVETLEVISRNTHLLPFRFSLRPTVRFVWGTSSKIY